MKLILGLHSRPLGGWKIRQKLYLRRDVFRVGKLTVTGFYDSGPEDAGETIVQTVDVEALRRRRRQRL